MPETTTNEERPPLEAGHFDAEDAFLQRQQPWVRRIFFRLHPDGYLCAECVGRVRDVASDGVGDMLSRSNRAHPEIWFAGVYDEEYTTFRRDLDRRIAYLTTWATEYLLSLHRMSWSVVYQCNECVERLVNSTQSNPNSGLVNFNGIAFRDVASTIHLFARPLQDRTINDRCSAYQTMLRPRRDADRRDRTHEAKQAILSGHQDETVV